MIDATLQIVFESEWLVAGGDSVLGTADMAAVKDDDGLPFVPGRSLRGVLREAVALIDDCSRCGWATELFGERLDPSGGRNYSEGTVRIGNATLVAEIAAACADSDLRTELYTSVRRTSLTDDRVARRHTLREMEVCVPGLILVAAVQVPDRPSLEVVAFAAGLVRSLGHGRSRGLGRCSLAVFESGAMLEVRVPPAGDRDS